MPSLQVDGSADFLFKCKIDDLVHDVVVDVANLHLHRLNLGTPQSQDLPLSLRQVSQLAPEFWKQMQVPLAHFRNTVQEMNDSGKGMSTTSYDLYFARRRLCKQSKIGEHTGGNEKCKLVVHLVAGGAGPPLRQPCDPQEENARLAWYFKRQQEQEVGLQLSYAHGWMCIGFNTSSDLFSCPAETGRW